MDRVYESGASAIAPTPPAVPSTGFPSRGNPGTGTMPTVPGPYMMHSLVEEIIAVISAAGIAPDKAVLNQLKLALDSIYMSKNGTSALLQNFAGLTRSMTALGGGLVREYVDITNAATVGGIEIGVVYNCAINTATGVWSGRDIADICWLEKWHDVAGTKEFWFAPTGAANAAPAWVNVFTLNANNGNLSISGAMTASALNVSTLNGGQLSGFRNKVINGDMRISQVNGATAVTPLLGSSYPIDQLKFNAAQSSKITVQQVVDAPAGFKFSAKVSVAAQYAPLATDFFDLQLPIEGQNIVDLGFGTATPSTIAVSLWVKGSIAGTYACALQNQSSRSYVGTINVTPAWTKQTVILTADNGGAWTTDNTLGVSLIIDLGSGTNFNAPATNAWQAGNYFRSAGSVTLVNQIAGSTLNITGVQLEQVSAGATSGTAFENVSYAQQLYWCQKYYESGIAFIGVGDASNAAVHPVACRFQVPKRVIPTIVNSSSATLTPAATAYNINGGAGLTSCTLTAASINELVTSTSVTVGTIAGYNYGAYFSASSQM